MTTCKNKQRLIKIYIPGRYCCLQLRTLCLTVLDETTLLLEAVIGSYCVLIIFKHEEECKWVDYCKHFWSSSFLTSKLMRFCVIVYLRHLQIQNTKVITDQIQKLDMIFVVMINFWERQMLIRSPDIICTEL